MRPNEFGDPKKESSQGDYRRGGDADGTCLRTGAGADGTRCRHPEDDD